MMRGNIAQLMQQAQKMQENMQRVQQEIAALEVTKALTPDMDGDAIAGNINIRTQSAQIGRAHV
mgnify:CR=1 FL=1